MGIEDHCTYGIEVVVLFEARLVFGDESWSNSIMAAAWMSTLGCMGCTSDCVGGADSGAAATAKVLSP